MCYAGGPYCAKLAKEKWEKSKKENPLSEKTQILMLDYAGTKDGQSYIQKCISESEDPNRKRIP